jgi:arylsulfatase A-like enzyme
MHKYLFCLLFICWLGGFSCQMGNQAKSTRPNILLIVADDLGFSDPGCFGGEIRTPHLDQLAAEGIRNTAFYTLPVCSPTRGMLLTGVDNHHNGYGTMEGDWAPNQQGVRGYEGHLNFDVLTFPRLLHDHGYHTSIAGKWHQATPPGNVDLWPDQRGFERSFCLMNGGAGHFADMQRMFSFYERSYYAEDGVLLDSLPEGFYSSDFYTDKSIAYINESQEQARPFFSFLSFTAPHWPLQVPDEDLDRYRGRYDEGYEVLAAERFARLKALGIVPEGDSLAPLSPNVLPWSQLSEVEQAHSARTMEIYAAMVERMDANIGRLLAHLKTIGVYDNTLVVFLADNGAEGNHVGSIVNTEAWVAENFDNRLENMGRPNSYLYTGPSWAQVSSLPWKWYKSFATEGGVRCPSIIRYPWQQDQAGTFNAQFISVMDLAPTFLELAGVEHPGHRYQDREIYPMDGISLLSWLQGERPYTHIPDAPHCWEMYGRRGVRRGNWKAEWMEPPYGANAWELYDLDKDPGEQVNLAGVYPEILTELTTAWDAYAERYELVLPSERVGYGPDKVWLEE